MPGCLKGLNGTIMKYPLFHTGRKQHYSIMETDLFCRPIWLKKILGLYRHNLHEPVKELFSVFWQMARECNVFKVGKGA